MVADEDILFRDFNFASSKPAVGSSLVINAPDFTSALNNNSGDADDDDWGDFVASEPSQPNSAPSRFDSGATHWEKMKGALPLSIFGEEEEEGEEGDGSGVSNPSATFLYNKSFDSAKKGLDLVNVDALIANLCKQTEPKNGSGPFSNGSGSEEKMGGKVDALGPNLKENELDLNWKWGDVNQNANALKEQRLGLDWNVLDSKPNELNSNGNVSNTVVKEGSLSVERGNGGFGNGNDDVGGDDDDYDDEGWEFKGAESNNIDGDEISRTNQIKAETALISRPNGLNSSSNALSVDSDGWRSNVGGVDKSGNWSNVSLVDENKKSDDGDGWEFKETNSRTQSGDESSTDGQIRAKTVPNCNLNGYNSSWIVSHSDSSALSSNFGAVHRDGKKLNTVLMDKSKDFDDANEWGFKGAESESHSGNGNPKFDQGDRLKSENGLTWKFDESDSGWSMLSLDGYGIKPISNGVNSDASPTNPNLFNENEDFEDDDGWEFKTAELEPGVAGEKAKENTEGPIYTFGFDNGAGGAGEMLVASKSTSKNSGEWNIGFNFNSSLTNGGISSNGFAKSENNDTQNSWHVSPIDLDSHENSWAFKDAFTETGSKDEESKVAGVSSSAWNFVSVGENLDKEKSDNHKGALPLSIFGDEEKEADGPVIYEDIATQRPTSNTSDDIESPHFDVSINDLISSLYSKAQLNTSVNITNENQTAILDFEESCTKLSTKTELNDYVDFISKLKEELHFLSMCHLENLKKARSAAALSSKDAETEALDKKIYDLHDEMHLQGMTSNELASENHLTRSIHLNEFIKVLQQPKFQMFESEYQWSKKLSLVKNDYESTIGLFRNVAATLKILSLVSAEEQSSYVSAWSKVLSACSQELKHGALVWKESLQKQVQDQILSEPQGKKYMIALGEIYRVVEVLGSSAKLYKPWILASSTDPSGIFALLRECYMLWSSSGLEEALRSISDPCNVEYDGSIETLVDSIKHVHELDALALYDHVFSGQDPMCRLSGLTTGAVPGMKTVIWNGECYFLTLANLWANIISCDPPNLPCIRVGR